MKSVRPLLVKASGLSTLWWQILILLSVGAFLKSMALAFWDIGSVSLLLSSGLSIHLGIDFMGAGLLLSMIGGYAWILERKRGYGSVAATTLAVFLISIFLILYEKTSYFLFKDFFFIIKYGLWLFLTTVFWVEAKRFVSFRFDSLKFLVVFCAELIGFLIAGLVTYSFDISPEICLINALSCMMGLVLFLKLLHQKAPIPKETFLKKTDGIRDVFERPLVFGILMLSFISTASRALMDAVWYESLLHSFGMQSLNHALGFFWFFFGCLGLFLIFALYHTRYIYTTLIGMLVVGFSVALTGLFGLKGHSILLSVCYFIFMMSSYFYLSGYLHVLPRPLSYGEGFRLKRRRLITAEPLGFVLVASILLNCDRSEISFALMVLGCFLVGAIMLSASLYSQVVLRMLKMRLWHGGPLMISFPKLTHYLQKLLKQKRADDVIYALRILEISNHPYYEKSLLKSLKHSTEFVRFFAVHKMRKLYRFSTFKYVFESLLKKDKSLRVRNAALTNLILLSGEGELDSENDKFNNPNQYLRYLDDPKLKSGAIGGFLKLGGDLALSAMDVLQKLARSKRIQDNLMALRLMADAPSPAFVRLMDELLKNPSNDVVREALLTAGSMKSPLLLSAVFKSLDDPNLQEEAMTALKMYGKAVFPPLEKMLTNPQVSISLRKKLILFLGALPSGEGKQILIRCLTIENQKLKKTIVQSIIDSGIFWIHRDKKDILKQCLKKDINRISWLLKFQKKYGVAPSHETEEAFDFLTRAVQEDIEDTRELILYQLLLMENNKMFVKAVRILLGQEYDLYLPAMGMIQDLLPSRLYQKLKPILILPLGSKQKETVTSMSEVEAVQGLSEMILHPPFVFNHWIRSTALYALRRLGNEEGIGAAEASLKDPHPIVLEAAIWCLVRLESNKDKLHQKLLKIPTSRLARQSLDTILES